MALWLAFPFILAYVSFRSLKNRAYLGTVGARCGFLPDSLAPASPGSIWVHAVSVGEVVSSVHLVAGLRRAVPGAMIFVSVGTLAGREIARQKLVGVADGVFYAPLDFLWAVRRVLRRLRPALLIVLETEIWPNLWREAKRSGAGLLVLNGRISDQAMPKYENWRWFFLPVLRQADRILAQTKVSLDRFIALGARPESVALGGNLKYDFDPIQAVTPPAVTQWAGENGAAGLVWVAASTMPPSGEGDADEDEIVLNVYQRLARDFPKLRLILVPRRPERFASAAAAMDKRAIVFARRSTLPERAAASVLLLDSMGELAGVFRVADVVFVGGTLCRRGGHNILEPAFFGKPVIIGPHMENFPEIARDFLAAQACLSVSDEAALEAALRHAISDDAWRVKVGESARRQAVAKTGATPLAVETARQLYEHSLPRPFRSWLLAGLSSLWRAGSRLKRARDLKRIQTLSLPVISVGGIGVGGAGKTPCVLHFAALLQQAGRHPAFLTRGYRRISQETCTVLAAGGIATVEQTGDEAQLLLRSGLGPVAICADRATGGRALQSQFAADCFVLDDGFQHARLARTADIVLIDTLDPFGGFDVIPAGRLREPLESLSRAGAFVLTRCEPGRTYEGILAVLRQHNPSAPVFRAKLEPDGWIDAATGAEPTAGPESRGAAFCGLGNPASFWRTLSGLGLEPAFRTTFGDHHRYHPRDLRRLDDEAQHHGVTVLWTTEKDMMNLPPDWSSNELSFRVHVLRVRVALEDEAGFLGWLLATLK